MTKVEASCVMVRVSLKVVGTRTRDVTDFNQINLDLREENVEALHTCSRSLLTNHCSWGCNSLCKRRDDCASRQS